MTDLIGALLASFRACLDEATRTDLCCLSLDEAVDGDRRLLLPAPLSATASLVCALAATVPIHAIPCVPCPSAATADSRTCEDDGATPPLLLLVAEGEGEVEARHGSRSASPTPAEEAAPPPPPSVSREARVLLRAPLDAAFVRRSFYYSEYYLPPPSDRRHEQGDEGAGSRQRSCFITGADREALPYLFPALHHDSVYATVEAFEAHCKSEAHLFLCESAPLFPLLLVPPLPGAPHAGGNAMARGGGGARARRCWDPQARAWFCALYAPVHAWLRRHLAADAAASTRRNVSALQPFIAFHLTAYLAERRVEQTRRTHLGATARQPSPVLDRIDGGGGTTPGAREEDKGKVGEAPPPPAPPRSTSAPTGVASEEEDEALHPALVCWTSPRSVVPFVRSCVRRWLAVELAQLLAPPLPAPAHLWARCGRTEEEMAGGVARGLAFHVGVHIVSLCRAAYKAQRRAACLAAPLPPTPTEDLPTHPIAAAEPIEAEDDAMSVACGSVTADLATPRAASLKRPRAAAESDAASQQAPPSPSVRETWEREQRQADQMYQLLLLLLTQDRTKLTGEITDT
ncbi:hypothetical protein STCU_12211 [Strigomonas culicis]|uniref:Uncharacterized protein n=1 Tax=Strigomonas culicis TaxID=28005 RepID=S9UXH5_9TRYP|nr:hypothetical protein STCU_12211 [Strigomonas culicis]|eukprot:EPY15240.1 hypothetical protein STCU_12211 [Strigomonas culicis]